MTLYKLKTRWGAYVSCDQKEMLRFCLKFGFEYERVTDHEIPGVGFKGIEYVRPEVVELLNL